MSTRKHIGHSSHWGAFTATVEDGQLKGVESFSGDPDPSPLLANFLGSIQSSARVARPAIRKGWLDRGPGPDSRRGTDTFVEVSWERASTSRPVIAEHTELFVAFGGIPLKNSAVSAGGTGEHLIAAALRAARSNGTRFVCVSPLRDDMPDWLDARWLAIEPGTDTALMLALAYVLRAEDLADRAFLATHCVGYEPFEKYPSGETDGIAKTPEWAAAITGIAPSEIAALAREMAKHRTMVSTSWSLQRSWYGEQPMWMSVVLAAMLGQIGLPGGGIGHGYGMTASTGMEFMTRMPAFPQGENAVKSFIPVARVAGMLLRPGAAYEYNGATLRYPDIRLVYWCGGNPFHHHQDLARLSRAFAAPDTVVVNDPFRTATTRHADFVLPATTTLERNDIGGSAMARHVFAMKQVLDPVGEARGDFDIFAGLAARLGVREAFTEGRDEMQWLRWMYELWRKGLAEEAGTVPDFDQFWAQGVLELSHAPRKPQVLLCDFRDCPGQSPLRTPERAHRDLVRGNRRVRLCGLRRASRMDGTEGVARIGKGHSARTDRKQSPVAPAQPARQRRVQPRDQGRRARTAAPEPAMRWPAALPAATSCGSSTGAAVASRAPC